MDSNTCMFGNNQSSSEGDIKASPASSSEVPATTAACTKLFDAFIQRAVPRFITANPRTRGMLVELIIRKVEESYPDAFVEYCASCRCGKSRVVPRDRVRAFCVQKLIDASKQKLQQKQVKAQKRKVISQMVQQANEAFRKQQAVLPERRRVRQVQFQLPLTDDEMPSPGMDAGSTDLDEACPDYST
jgi:hypothetical protein